MFKDIEAQRLGVGSESLGVPPLRAPQEGISVFGILIVAR